MIQAKISIRRTICCALALFFGARAAVAYADFKVIAASAEGGYGVTEVHEDLTPAFYDRWARDVAQNLERLQSNGTLARNKAVGTTRFIWPLRSAPGRPEFFPYSVTNFIDHNTTQGAITDFQCGTRSYDNANGGHRGTDISLPGIPYLKMAQEASIVVAAADGVIVSKADGNFDRNCGSLQDTSVIPAANMVTLRHADGMLSLYFHMKSGSLTSKAVGDSVVTGEFLGVVGSSGFSTGPHLHFEVRGTNNEVLDPWAGSCNATTSGLWTDQAAILSKGVSEIMASAQPPAQVSGSYTNLFGSCSNGQSPQVPDSSFLESKWHYQAGESVTTTIFLREVRAGDLVGMRLLNSQGAVVASGSVTAASSFVTGFYFFTRTIPLGSAPGQYSLEATYAGETKSTPIYVGMGTPTPARVFDFYANSINHFFRVANPIEAAAVAGGAAGDWATTLDDLNFLARGSTLPGVADVCRFYGHFTIGPNSHFYTADAGECAQLKALQASTPFGTPRWNYEEVAFAAHLPVNGVCPAAAPIPVYRLYNNGFARNDSNHRLTSKLSVVSAQRAKGWSLENNGNPVMCAVSRPY